MAKKKASKVNKKAARKNAKKNISKVDNPQAPWRKWILPLMLLVSFVLYGNTLGHQYAQDDAIVITDNMFTQDGVSGWGGILTKDTFFGFFKKEGKDKLVSGGRYRPLTLMMFALEWQIFGKNPFIGHLINILLYGLLGWLIFMSLRLITIDWQDENSLIFALSCALLFLAHPIHTEAVANIKGRDEIMTMMGAMGGLYFVLKYVHSSSKKYFILSGVLFFIGLMSKENAITFLAIIPAALALSTKTPWAKTVKPMGAVLIATIVFLLIRSSILGMDFGGSSRELMNNPFLKLVDGQWIDVSFGEKFATIFYTLLKYIQLLIVPHPLVHDYYPRSIEIMNWGQWQPLLSLALYVGMVVVMIRSWSTHKMIAWGILFYLATLSIVSNIVFPIGTNMGERFLFIPSLGFVIILVKLLLDNIGSRKILFATLGLIFGLYALKTITRNPVWHDDYTLFQNDIKLQPNSAKLRNAAGGSLITSIANETDQVKINTIADQAIVHLNEALRIHPTYENPVLILGNAHFYKKEFDKAIGVYDGMLQRNPNNANAKTNLALSLRDAGRNTGEKERNYPKAQQYLERSIELLPDDIETLRLLGIVYGIQGLHQKSASTILKAISINDQSSALYGLLSTAYNGLGDQANAVKYQNRADQLKAQGK